MPFFLNLRTKARKSSLNRRILSSLNASTANMPSLKSYFGSRPAFKSNQHDASDPTAPPAYSATPSSNAKSTPHSSTAAPPSTSNADTEFSFLSTFDTIFLIDDSSSMAGRSWRETREALKTVTPICTAYDADGIDLYFLNESDNVEYKNIINPAVVETIFNNVRPGAEHPPAAAYTRYCAHI
jgi:hypothetical protein